MLENVARIIHDPPGWGGRGRRIWENRGSGAGGPYVNDGAVETGHGRVQPGKGSSEGKCW